MPTVSTDNGVYGVPIGTATGGGVFYLIPALRRARPRGSHDVGRVHLQQPGAQGAGKDPVIQSYGDTWTSQLFVLGDFYNVSAEDPDWAEKYTANERKYVDEPALAGFQHLQEVFESGLLNEDFARRPSTTVCNMVGHGEGDALPDADLRDQHDRRELYPEPSRTLASSPSPATATTV